MVASKDGVTQRSLAMGLGIALGLLNAYVKRCVRKGLIKVQRVPRGRFVYYLTPRGFAEKSRLTATYLSQSFDFFRRARHECDDAFRACVKLGRPRIALVGASDLAEVAILCSFENEISIIAVVDRAYERPTFAGVAVAQDLMALSSSIDAALITDTVATEESFNAAVRALGADRVLVPELLKPALSHMADSSGRG
jgi:DNA-binding MarR family transcriptional regulator